MCVCVSLKNIRKAYFLPLLSLAFIILEMNLGHVELKIEVAHIAFCVGCCRPLPLRERGEMLKLGREKVNKWVYREFAGKNVSSFVYYFTYFMPDRLSLGPYLRLFRLTETTAFRNSYIKSSFIYLRRPFVLLLHVPYVLGYYLGLLFCPYYYQHLQNDDLYCSLFLARPVKRFFLSCLATFGV